MQISVSCQVIYGHINRKERFPGYHNTRETASAIEIHTLDVRIEQKNGTSIYFIQALWFVIEAASATIRCSRLRLLPRRLDSDVISCEMEHK